MNDLEEFVRGLPSKFNENYNSDAGYLISPYCFLLITVSHCRKFSKRKRQDKKFWNQHLNSVKQYYNTEYNHNCDFNDIVPLYKKWLKNK